MPTLCDLPNELLTEITKHLIPSWNTDDDLAFFNLSYVNIQLFHLVREVNFGRYRHRSKAIYHADDRCKALKKREACAVWWKYLDSDYLYRVLSRQHGEGAVEDYTRRMDGFVRDRYVVEWVTTRLADVVRMEKVQ